jgi:hypothetical protein
LFWYDTGAHASLARTYLFQLFFPSAITFILCSRTCISQIIIDSIAAPARKDFDHREKSAMQQRQLLLARIASKLKCVDLLRSI